MRLRALAAALLLVPGLASASPYTFVSTPASDSVVVIDLASHTVVGTVPVGGLPSGAAVGPLGDRLYVALSQSNALAMIDLASGSVASLPVGAGPCAVAVGSGGRRVYVANTAAGTVSVVDAARRLVIATIPVGDAPTALLANGRRLYVANWGSASLSVIDTTTNAVMATLPVGNFPAALALHRRSGRLYVANSFDATVSVIDTSSLSVAATFPVARTPRALTLDPAGSRLYVASFDDARVQIVDTGTGNVTLEADSGGLNPLDLMLGPDGLYVAHLQETQGIAVLDPDTLAPLTSVSVPAGPVSFAGLSLQRPPTPFGSSLRMAARALFQRPPEALSLAAQAPAQRGVEDVVITDTEFPVADWSASGGGEWFATQQASGGNPGAYRRMTHFGQGSVAHVLIRPGTTYNPGVQNAIQFIDVAWDRRVFSETLIDEGFLVQQAGVVYRSEERAVTEIVWQRVVQTGLAAGAFDDGHGGHPDFSASGAPIRFGYYRRTLFNQTTEHGIDNFMVTVHPVGTNLAGTLAFEKSLVVMKEDNAPLIYVERAGGTQGAVGAEVLIERPDGGTDVKTVSWADGDASPQTLLPLGLDLPPGSGARMARLSIRNVTGGASLHSTRSRMQIAVMPMKWGPELELLYLRLLGLISSFSPAWLLVLAVPAVFAARRSR